LTSTNGRKPAPAGRIGIFGGTFDPVHEGHLAVARAARDAFRLDLVLFVPAPRPWLRPRSPVAPPEDRLAMVELATAHDAHFGVSRTDLDRPGPTYTADTLRELRAQYGPLPEFYLVLGADSLRYLDRWERLQDVVGQCVIAAVGRPGAQRPAELPESHPGRHALFVEGPMVEVSATEIRSRLAEGKSCAGMLPEEVEDYIRDRGLYHARKDPATSAR
jgi:nicotinate-nucleotide adenylyltransferase